jgi:hypothetical protein
VSGRRIIRHSIVTTMTLAIIGGSLLAAPGAAATTRIVQARRNASVALPSGSRAKVVQSVTLASGPWTVMAKAFVVDLTSGESDYFRCDLYNATSNRSLDVSAGWVASDFPGNMITNMAKLKVAKGTTVTIDQRCWHDHTGIGHAYLDPGATLLAFKASSATDNRLYRSTSAIDLPNANNNEQPVTVASLGLSSGTWVFGFKATAVNSDRQDHIECDLRSFGSVNRLFASVSGDAGWSRASTFTAFSLDNLSNNGTVTVNCISTYGVTYLDPDLVLWARKVPNYLLGGECGTVSFPATVAVVADIRDTSCSIGTGASASQVGGVTVFPGSYVILGAEQAVRSTAKQFIRCRAQDVTHNKSIDANATMWARPNDSTSSYANTTYLGQFSSNEATTVEFRCGQDASAIASSEDGTYLALSP